MENAKVARWAEKVLPHLDAPETLIPEINSIVRPWEAPENADKAKVCIVTPVEYSAAVANMGVAIIYDILNSRYDGAVCERVYYPEPKLRRRMVKDKIPLFSKETRNPLKDFDLLAFSSFYPLQMLAFHDMMEMSHMSPFATDQEIEGETIKGRGEDCPIVALAGVSAFNPAPVHNVVDAVFIGEGEKHVRQLVDILKEEKSFGPGWKWRTLFRWTNELDGVYVPQFYREEYYGADHQGDPMVDKKGNPVLDEDGNQKISRPKPAELKSHKQISPEEIFAQALEGDERAKLIFDNLGALKPDGKPIVKPRRGKRKNWIVPEVIKKAIFAVDEEKPLTTMFVSNSEGQAMSAGSLMIANSCSNKCYFCQGSFVSQPYRERSFDVLQAGFSELIRNTGAIAVTPYSFNLSDHSRVNEIVHWLMADEGRKVSMSSQRIDYFSPDFARAAYLSGNKSITLAIEGGSQRMRDRISKNLTEPMILDAFRTAFRIGFARIKIYMISNLPEELDEDREAIVDLARKIFEVQREVQGDKLSTKVRWSWTPFTSKNFTPLQWCKTLEVNEETGLPMMEKNMEHIISGLRDFGYKFRVGTNSDVSIVNQCITHGDRRMATVLWKMYKSEQLNYAGGMSVGKEPLIEVQDYLRAEGLDYEYFLREKHEDEVFPWDHINILVTKRFLWDMFVRHKNAENVAICFDDCTKCGACTPESVKHFNARKDNSLEPDIANVSDALTFKRKKSESKLRLKFSVDPKWRYVHSSKIKMLLRRAGLRAGLPIKNEFTLASDRILVQNWTAGIDYAEVVLVDKIEDTSALVEQLNQCLLLGVEGDGNLRQYPITVMEAQVYSDKAKNFRSSYEKVLYSIEMPKKVAPIAVVEKVIGNLLASEKYDIKLKVKGMTQDSWQTIIVDARPSVHGLWAIEKENSTEIRMVLSDQIGPYELLPNLFKTSKRRILVYPARRLEFFMPIDEGAQDMFAGLCEETGEEIEQNMFGEEISDRFAARFVHLDEEAEAKMQTITREQRIAKELDPNLLSKFSTAYQRALAAG